LIGFVRLTNFLIKYTPELKQTISGEVSQSLSASKPCGICRWHVIIILL